MKINNVKITKMDAEVIDISTLDGTRKYKRDDIECDFIVELENGNAFKSSIVLREDDFLKPIDQAIHRELEAEGE